MTSPRKVHANATRRSRISVRKLMGSIRLLLCTRTQVHARHGAHARQRAAAVVGRLAFPAGVGAARPTLAGAAAQGLPGAGRPEGDAACVVGAHQITAAVAVLGTFGPLFAAAVLAVGRFGAHWDQFAQARIALGIRAALVTQLRAFGLRRDASLLAALLLFLALGCDGIVLGSRPVQRRRGSPLWPSPRGGSLRGRADG